MSQNSNQDEAAKQEAERQAIRERVLRVILTPEARQRLANLKMVKPDFAKTIEDQLIRLASDGRLKRPFADEDLKEMLQSMQTQKREFKIRWV